MDGSDVGFYMIIICDRSFTCLDFARALSFFNHLMVTFVRILTKISWYDTKIVHVIQ